MIPVDRNIKPKILFVDDESSNQFNFEIEFHKYYEIYLADSVSQALTILKDEIIQVVISDQKMPNQTGIDLFEILNNEHSITEKILLTGYADLKSVLDAINRGKITNYLTKPYEKNNLKLIIDNAVDTFYLKVEKQNLIENIEETNLNLEIKTKQLEQEILEKNALVKQLKIKQDLINEKNRILFQQNIELANAMKQAEESDRLKSIFLANMSHEIRTPLNGILGFVQLLQNKSISDDKRDSYLKTITHSGNQLLKIVSDLIDISKIEADQMEIYSNEVCLNDIMTDIFHSNKALAIEKNLNLSYTNELETIESNIITDETKLRQILFNLVHNGLKYTMNGSVHFGYKVENDQLLFYIKDSGIGIPIEQQKLIFNRFYQISSGIYAAEGGNGLGLAITKAFTELLNGKIWLESTFGEGSNFYVSLPYQPGKTKENKPIPEVVHTKSKQKKSILIIEDSEVNYLFLAEVLADYNVNISHAINGKEALNNLDGETNFDLVLLDIKLPDMSGYDIAKIIRENNSTLPIIAQTAHATVFDKEKALQVGCNHYLSKPIDTMVLKELLDTYLV